MKLDEFKLSLCAFINKPLIWINNAVSFRLVDGSEFHFEYEAETDDMHMRTAVENVSPEQLDEYAAALLRGNLFGRDTGGFAVFAHDPVAGSIVLWDRMPLHNITSAMFWKRFSCIFLARAYWASRMKKGAGVANKVSLPLSPMFN